MGASQSKRLWAEDGSTATERRHTPAWPFGARPSKSPSIAKPASINCRVASAHDVGKAINPLAVTGQIEGGIMMGLGYALSEALLFDEGKITNASFADYKIPTMRDIPSSDADHRRKKLRLRTVRRQRRGRMSVFGIAPAVANAVARLTGVRIKDLPLSAEKLSSSSNNRRRNEWRFRKNEPLHEGNLPRPYEDVRQWLELVESMGELKRIDGADWNLEIGTMAELIYRERTGHDSGAAFRPDQRLPQRISHSLRPANFLSPSRAYGGLADG